MNNIFRCGKQGGRHIIDFPKEYNGLRFVRSVWKDGTVVFKEVEPDVE